MVKRYDLRAFHGINSYGRILSPQTGEPIGYPSNGTKGEGYLAGTGTGPRRI